MQNPYAANCKKKHDCTRNKGAFEPGIDFLAFIQMLCKSKKKGCGANQVNHNGTNDKDRDKFSIISSISLLIVLIQVRDDRCTHMVILGGASRVMQQ